MIGHQETDLGEPRVYGGYGSGANAEQVAVDLPEPTRARDGSVMVYVADLDRTFPSIKDAAAALGVSRSGLSTALKKRKTEFMGHKVRYA